MITCKYCGNENLDEVKFCTACGKSIGDEITPAETLVDDAVSVAPQEVTFGDDTPVVPSKPKKNKALIIIGIIVGIIAVIGIAIAILYPTILRAVLGETNYYILRESAYLTDKSGISDVSLDGLKKSELKLTYSENGEDVPYYAVATIGESGKELAFDIIYSIDGESEKVGTLELGDGYITLSLPFASSDVYYYEYKSSDAEVESDENSSTLINDVFDSFNSLNLEDYVTAEKDGKNVIFTSDTERLLKLIDAIVVELNKHDSYKEIVEKAALYDEGLVQVLNGTYKVADEFDSEYNEIYKYVVTYEGRHGIALRELFVDDESIIKISENDNKEIIIANEYFTITISDIVIKEMSGSKLPTFTVKYEEDGEAINFKLDVSDNVYSFVGSYDDENVNVAIEKLKEIEEFSVTPKEDCEKLDENSLGSLGSLVGIFF